MRRRAAIAGGLGLLTALLYAPTASFPFQVFDDGKYVENNPRVLEGLSAANVAWAWTTFTLSNWHPLTWMSYQFDATWGGRGAGHFHVVNVVLHAADAVLVFLLLDRLSGKAWRAAAVAALFAVHPQHVESVAWVAERKDVLSTFFALLALHAYVSYARSGPDAARPRRTAYVLCAVCFALALLAKQMPVTLPCVCLLLDVWPLRRARLPFVATPLPSPSAPPSETVPWSRLLAEKLPLFALSLAFSIVVCVAQSSRGALKDFEAVPFDARLANAVVAYGSYLAKTFVPVRLAVFYPHPGAIVPAGPFVLSLLVLLAVTAWAVRSVARSPHVAVGWFWFLGTLVPVVGLVQVGDQQSADRYVYLPHVGLFLAVVWELAERTAEPARLRRAAAGAFLVLVAVLAWRTHAQIALWGDRTTLLEHTLRSAGPSRFAHANLGVAYSRAGRQAEALEQFEAAARVAPGRWRTHYNAANAALQLGDLARAERHFDEALRLEPSSAELHNNVGMLRVHQGRPDLARRHFESALGIDPQLRQARENLARLGAPAP